jgi:hypothetical protein
VRKTTSGEKRLPSNHSCPMGADRHQGHSLVTFHHITNRHRYRLKKTGGPTMKLFATAGRANRARYFFHSLGASLAFLVFIVLLHAIAPLVEQSAAEPNMVGRTLYAGSILVALVVFLATETCVTIQRLHDLDRPGSH